MKHKQYTKKMNECIALVYHEKYKTQRIQPNIYLS